MNENTYRAHEIREQLTKIAQRIRELDGMPNTADRRMEERSLNDRCIELTTEYSRLENCGNW